MLKLATGYRPFRQTDAGTAPPDVIREPFGRIAIGHSERRGHQYWSGAAGEGRRAVEALVDQYFLRCEIPVNR